jgi:hypothetical protein
MPKDEALAPNPPDGAIIDYVLPAQLRGPVRLAILDAHGAIVRRFSSDKIARPPGASKLKIAPEWIEKPIPLRASPGQHRFVWDVHYEPPAELSGEDGNAKGVWAPPGRYTVVLTVSGQDFRQELEVKPDPRIKADAGDYLRQFALAQQIETVRVELRKALREAQALHARLTSLAARAHSRRRSNLLDLDNQLARIADPVPDEPRWVSPEPEHGWGTLHDLSVDFDRLGEAVDGADGRPTADAEDGFRRRQAALASGLRAWNDLSAKINSATK